MRTIVINERDMHPEFGQVPISKGVPRSVHILAAIGIAVIFVIGGFVAFTSGFGHHWPSQKTLRVDLGSRP